MCSSDLFTIRPISGLTKAAGFNYVNNLLTFHLLNSSSESLCGGSPITASTSLYILNKDTTRGSFSCESTNGNVFYWHHSINPIASYASGVPSGSRNYNGSEQLVLVYNSALITNMQVDIYASATSVFNQTLQSVSRS